MRLTNLVTIPLTRGGRRRTQGGRRATLQLSGAALLVGLLVLVLGPSAAAAGKRVPNEFFGLAEGGSANARDYELMGENKVPTMRITVSWNRTEPRRGTFRWPDGRVLALARHGIRPVITVLSAPKWATRSSNPAKPPVKGTAKMAWQDFLELLVERYKPDGVFWRTHPAVSPEPVTTWQIWNEPNLKKYFKSKNPPKNYAKLVKASDKAIGRADPRAKTILAGLTGNARKKKLQPNKFLKKFLKVQKIKKRFNAAALHPYARSFKELESRVRKLSRTMKNNGAKKKDLWLTEIGWGSESSKKHPLNKGKKGQARLLKKSFKLAMEKRKKWHLGRVFWFDWRDPPPGAPEGCTFCPTAGLLKFDGTKKPSFRKFRHFMNLQARGAR
jgi:hypothetical protein